VDKKEKVYSEYGIGLDIGTNSVGWVVVDLQGKLIRVRGKMGIGVRLFKEGQHASKRRSFRASRRRLKRVKWRLRLLRELFDKDVVAVDPGFFVRQKYSGVSPNDSHNHGVEKTIFNDRTDHDFYEKYPTIYHLRHDLMVSKDGLSKNGEPFDIREIYLAIHHIVKHRGNFLRVSEENFKPTKINLDSNLENISTLFRQLSPETVADDIFNMKNNTVAKQVLLNPEDNSTDKEESLKDLWTVESTKNVTKQFLTAFIKAILGLKVNFGHLILKKVNKKETKKWTWRMASFTEKLDEIRGDLSDTEIEMLEVIESIYSAITLAQIMPEGRSFSESMIEKYDKHASDLKKLKVYANQQEDTKKDKIYAVYAAYIKKDSDSDSSVQETFYKKIKAQIKVDKLSDKTVLEMLQDIEDGKFMPKQRTIDNIAIPFQVHQLELDTILGNLKNNEKYAASKHTWLAENPIKKRRGRFPFKIDELIGFRVPYYVGPLIEPEQQKVQSKANFAWMKRKAEGEITPWNFEEKVDKKASAIRFSKRMQSTDTYLVGENVLPKCSLAYQRYEVLNELNNLRIDGKGPLTKKAKSFLLKYVFENRAVKTISLKTIKEKLRSAGIIDINDTIRGLADESKFNSSLSTYRDLREVIPNELSSSKYQDDIERIIEWATIFEDQHLRESQLAKVDWLTSDQRTKLAAKRYRGWGRLSKKLLQDFKNSDGYSILDCLLESPNNFMQLIRQKDFKKQIELTNSAEISDDEDQNNDLINQQYMIPQNKKAIRQVLGVVKDITKAMGGTPPKQIFIEAARDEKGKGKRSNSRSQKLKELYGKTAKDIVDAQVKQELGAYSSDIKMRDAVYLYFTQNGEDAYSNDKLSLNNVLQGKYHIDHIIPRWRIKDDSLDNLVLTTEKHNLMKAGNWATSVFNNSQNGKWQRLNKCGLISKRKLNHLMMTDEDFERQSEGFINRQLVEARQVIKLSNELLKNRYPDTEIVSVRASLNHQFRKTFDLPKLRRVNNYHHAIDAYLTAFIGTFMLKAYPNWHNYFVYGKFRKTKNNMKKGFNFIYRMSDKKDPIITSEKNEVIWNRPKDLTYIEKIFNFKQILVVCETRMDVKDLFKQTLHKATSNKKNLIPKKRNLDTAIYGGYSDGSASYLAIVKTPSLKNVDYLVTKVPTRKLQMIRELKEKGFTDKVAVHEALLPIMINSGNGNYKKIVDFEVIVPYIQLNQLVLDKVYGHMHRFRLGTDQYYHNTQEMYLSLEMQRKLDKYYEDPADWEDTLVLAYDQVTKQTERYFWLYGMNKFKSTLIAGHKKFDSLPLKDIEKTKEEDAVKGKHSTLNLILEGLHADANYTKLTQFGMKTKLGFLQKPGNIRLTADAVLIYQSMTGLFEHSVFLKDL